KNADVAADRDQQASQVEPVSGIGFHGSEDAGYLSRGAHTPNRVIDSGPHFRMRVVAQMPHIRRQVARADEQPIYSVYGRNRFQVSERGSSLNLHDYTDLVMHPLEILLHPTVSIGPDRRGDAADSFRGIAGRGDRFPRFVGVLNERDKKALHSHVEEALEQDRVVPGWTNHRAGGAAGRGLQLAVNHRKLVRRVLGVEQDPIEACAGNDFDGNMTRQAAPQTDLRAPFAQATFKLVGLDIDVHANSRSRVLGSAFGCW